MSCGQKQCPDNVAGRVKGTAFAESIQTHIDQTQCKAGFFAGVMSALLRQIVTTLGHEGALTLLVTCYGAVMSEHNRQSAGKLH